MLLWPFSSFCLPELVTISHRPSSLVCTRYLLCKLSDLSSFFLLSTIYSSIPFPFSPEKVPPNLFLTLRRRCRRPPPFPVTTDHPDGNTVRTLVLYFWIIIIIIIIISPFHFYFIFNLFFWVSNFFFFFFFFPSSLPLPLVIFYQTLVLFLFPFSLPPSPPLS